MKAQVSVSDPVEKVSKMFRFSFGSLPVLPDDGLSWMCPGGSVYFHTNIQGGPADGL